MGSGSRLVLVRHGATAWSDQRRHTGRTDLGLTEEGVAGAIEIGRRLRSVEHRYGPYAYVVSSPLERARRTCELAGFGADAELDDDLMEWDYGRVEGRQTVEIRVERPGWSLWAEGPDGGETLDDVARRARRFTERLERVQGTTVVFAHGHLLRILATQWCGWPAVQAQSLWLDPSTYCVLAHDRDVRVIERWNA